MKTVLLYIGHNVSDDLLKECLAESSFLIGVDQGAALLAKKGIRMDVAVGDFDSCGEEDVALIKRMTDKIIVLNPIKDDTDTAHAITLCDGYGKIVILGAIQGKRIEHLFANAILLQNDSRIELLDNDSSMRCLLPGEYKFSNDVYSFISFFALEPSILSLHGFVYDLENYSLLPNDPLCVSNQLKADSGELSLDKGKLLVVQSKKD